MSPPLPRGRCPVCGRDVALRKNGIIREHRAPGETRVCRGAGLSTDRAMKVYRGRRLPGGSVSVTVERGEKGTTEFLRQVVVHSPTGFEWGYGGSGPADLALSILADLFGERQRSRPLYTDRGVERAWRLHDAFKWDWVARVSQGATEWAVGELFIRAWVANQEAMKS